MLPALEARRVLVAVEPGLAASLRDLFGQALFAGWQFLQADDLEQVRFLLQHQSCHVLVADQTVWPEPGSGDAAGWGRRFQLPVLLLVQRDFPEAGPALGRVVRQWLPVELALKYPVLLAGALNQAAELTDLRRHTLDTGRALQFSRRQVDQLVSMLWRTLPADVEAGWLSQRHLLERLRQEVNRASRHAEPLTVVLGEAVKAANEETAPLDDWLADCIVRTKRLCDLVGQYGPRGFLLLLVNTDEPGGMACCRRLAKALSQPGGPGGPHVKPCQFCFGTASLSPAASTCTRLLSLAEQSLEAAKAMGRSLESAV